MALHSKEAGCEMKFAILMALPVLCLSADVMACSSHPGQSHEEYVTSLRKRDYDKPVVSTYSTFIPGLEKKTLTKNTGANAPVNSQPVTNSEKSNSFFDSVGR